VKLTDKVKTHVVEFTKRTCSKARRGSPAVYPGTVLYAIKYEIGGYFTYSYATREAAEDVRQAGIKHGTDTYQFYQFNVVADADDTRPYKVLSAELK
jgi:hypothetical protein